MNITEYLEILSNDSPNPCYFIDLQTKEIAFLNQTFQRKFQIFDEYQGKLYNEVLPPSLVDSLGFENESNLVFESGVFHKHCVYDDWLKANLRSNSTVIDVQGRKLLMTKFFLTADNEQQIELRQSFDEAMTECLQIMEMPDRSESLKAFLKLLCSYYSAEVAYIYEFNHRLNGLERAFHWNAKKNSIAPPEQQSEDEVVAFLKWLKSDYELVNVESMSDLHLSENDKSVFFDRFNMSNITLNKLWNSDGTLLGIVGISNRLNPIKDDRLLKAVSLFVNERFNEASVTRTLRHLNEVDLLTGFFNRNKYAGYLQHLQIDQPKQLGVVFVNLNGLRQTNEYFGFEVGDKKIKNTSKILRNTLNADYFRISGDEFVGFVADISSDDFEKAVLLLRDKLKEINAEATFAVGHSWDSGSYSVMELIKVADTVMTINKQSYYSENFNENKEVSNIMLQDLLQAISDDEFMVYLQPQLDLKTEKVIGAEALIRRYDKKLDKMVFPDQFIPMYEKNSIIRHVDLFVIKEVCRLLQKWSHYETQYQISVNLSRVTLLEYGIVTTISDILDKYDVSHSQIVIEVTERIGVIENDVASNLIDEFKQAGFRISLDDFGCAYSNIITLAQISVDEVKLDKSLVDNVLTSDKNSIIVKNMLSMCNEIKDTSTLAEGIETREQADFLRDVNCHLGQGYLFSRPIPSTEFEEKYIIC